MKMKTNLLNKNVFDKLALSLLFLIFLFGLAMHFIGPPDSLDTKLYYSAEQAQLILSHFSESDLKAYFLNEILDLGFLTTYTLFFIVVLRRLYVQKTWLVLFPLIAGVSDLIETTGIICVLKFPGSNSLFKILGIFTCTKWVFGFVVLVLILMKCGLESYLKSKPIPGR